MKKKSEDVKSEAETRKEILRAALYHYGPEGCRQIQMHFDKYDAILAKCTNESERKHIKILATTELYKMMKFYQGLSIDGVEIIPPEKINE